MWFLYRLCRDAHNTLVKKNHNSALQQKEVIENHIQKSFSLGWITGPFSTPPYTPFVLSPLGVVPKSEPGKFRIINDLSYSKFGQNQYPKKITLWYNMIPLIGLYCTASAKLWRTLFGGKNRHRRCISYYHWQLCRLPFVMYFILTDVYQLGLVVLVKFLKEWAWLHNGWCSQNTMLVHCHTFWMIFSLSVQLIHRAAKMILQIFSTSAKPLGPNQDV